MFYLVGISGRISAALVLPVTGVAFLDISTKFKLFSARGELYNLEIEAIPLKRPYIVLFVLKGVHLTEIKLKGGMLTLDIETPRGNSWPAQRTKTHILIYSLSIGLRGVPRRVRNGID